MVSNKSGLTFLNLTDPISAEPPPMVPPATVGRVRNEVLAILKRNRDLNVAALEISKWLSERIPVKVSARWFADDLEISDPVEFQSHERVRRCVEIHGHCIAYDATDSLFVGSVCQMVAREEALGWWKATAQSTLGEWRAHSASVGRLQSEAEPVWPEGVKFWRTEPVAAPQSDELAEV